MTFCPGALTVDFVVVPSRVTLWRLALLVVVVLPPLVCAAGAPPTRRQVRRAQAHVDRGDRAFEAGRYADAIADYGDAFALVPNPTLLWNIARAYEHLDDLAMARLFFERYAAADLDPDRRRAVSDKLAQLRAGTTPPEPKSSPSSSPPAAVPAPETVDVPAVPTTVTVADRGSVRTAGWIALGLSAALLGGGGALYGVAASDFDRIESAARDPDGTVTGMTRGRALELQDRANDMTAAGVALLAIGATGLATSITLLLVDDGPGRAVTAVPTSDGAGAGVLLQGRF